jgi:hypothetical protein
MKNLVLPGLLAMSLPLALVVVVGATAAEKASSPARSDGGEMCTRMMQETSPEGRRAMREFMASERAPQAMSSMMEMARRMGDGDMTLGMTRMMEMMGSMGGGTMGQGGMMQPRGK